MGELLIAGFSGSSVQSPSAQALAEQIHAAAVGGVVFVKDNVGDKDDVLGLVRLFSAGAPRKVIVAIDHEGGAVQRLVEAHGCARLPSARQVATDRTVAEAQELCAEAGRTVARLGFNLNLAPVVDLENVGNPAIGHYGRAFSGDADTVTAYASAFVRGFKASGVCCVLKHFPGQGGAVRNQLEFNGVAMTDDLDMGAVGYGFARRSAIMQALEAGNDGLMVRNRKNYDPALPETIALWMSEGLADGTFSIDALNKSADRVRKLRNNLNQVT